MRTLTFNQNSWHYKLATLVGFERWNNQDICTYTRYVIGGCIMLAAIGTIIGLVGFILSEIVLGIIFSIIFGMLLFSDAALVFMGLVVFLGAVVGGISGIKYLVEAAERRRCAQRIELPKPDGFVKNAYKGWKEKYCVKIEFIKPE